MLRIDLLPNYVLQRKRVKTAFVAFLALWIVCTIFPLGYYAALKSQESDAAAAAKQAADWATDTQNLTTEATNTLTAVGPISDKIKFVAAVREYNTAYPRLYDLLARYTDIQHGILYSSAAVNGSTVTVNAYTPKIDEVGRFLAMIWNEPEFKNVTIDHLPGYPDALVNQYWLDGKLISTGQDPRGGGGGGGGAPGMPSFMNIPGGASGNIPAGALAMMQAGGGGGGGNFGGAASPILDQIADERVNPLASPQQRDRLKAKVIAELKKRIIVKRVPRGFSMTVTCSLRKPLSVPVIPGGGGGQPTFGAPAGFGGA